MLNVWLISFFVELLLFCWLMWCSVHSFDVFVSFRWIAQQVLDTFYWTSVWHWFLNGIVLPSMHPSLDQCAKTEKSCSRLWKRKNPKNFFAKNKSETNIETSSLSVSQILHTLPKTNIDPEKTALADDSPTSQGLRSSLGVASKPHTWAGNGEPFAWQVLMQDL